MSKEAMKLALEALEQLDGIDTETECVTFDVGEAITALREALAEQPAQQEPIGKVIASVRHLRSISVELLPEVDVPSVDSMIFTSPPAQQEPVTWGVDWGKAGDIPCVSIIKRLPGGGIEVVAVEYAPYEYNPPAQRTWVDLTDEEFENAWSQSKGDVFFRIKPFALAIEAKLKEKNNG